MRPDLTLCCNIKYKIILQAEILHIREGTFMPFLHKRLAWYIIWYISAAKKYSSAKINMKIVASGCFIADF